MIKLWFKLMIDDKIIKNTIFSKNIMYSPETLTNAISEVCNSFDIANPLILSKHIFHFENFNTITFLPDDFVEPFNYDKLIIENIYED